MAVVAARDTLSLGAAVLDTSEEIWDETKRLAKHFETRKAASDLADLRSAARSNAFQSAATVLTAVDAPLANKLTSALRDANAAASALEALQKGRELVVSSRVEALQAKESEIAAAREALKVEMASKKSSADAEFLSAIRPLAARHPHPDSLLEQGAGSSPAAAAAAESSESAQQQSAPASVTTAEPSAAASAESDDSLL